MGYVTTECEDTRYCRRSQDYLNNFNVINASMLRSYDNAERITNITEPARR